MLKHFRQGTGLLVESEARIEQTVPGGWRPVAKLDISQELKERANSYKGVGNIVLSHLTKAAFTEPIVYIQGTPDANIKATEKAITNPTSFNDWVDAVAISTKAGYPPHRFRVYIAGPSPATLDKLIGKVTHAVYGLLDKEVDSKGDFDRKRVDAGLDAIGRVFGPVAEAASVQNKILAWFDVTIGTEGISKTSRTRFSFTEKGNAVVGLATAHPKAPISRDEREILTMYPVDTRKDTSAAVIDAVKKAFYNTVWLAANHYVFDHFKGPSNALHRALNQAPDVRTGYDTHHGRPIPTTPKKTDYHRDDPHTNVELFGDTRVVSGRRIALADSQSKVIPSMESSGGDIGTNIVTADPSERRLQKTDGSFTRVPPLKSNVKTMVPTDRVAPLIDEDKYAIIFGIHYDSPLLSPKLNNQLYWYSSRNQFFGSVKLFGELTGDRPNIAYRILLKRGKSAGMTVSLSELEKDKSADGKKAYRELTQAIQSFWRHANQGQKVYPAKMEQRLGRGKFVVLNKQPLNPTQNVPEGIDPDKWKKYLTHVRTTGEKTLGLRFKIPLEFDAEGRQTTLRFDANARFQTLQRKRARRAAGLRDPKTDRAVEPWGVYLIEYILGFTSGASTAGNAHFIPLNVVRSPNDLPPRETPKRMTKTDLMQMLREHFSTHPAARAATEASWSYIRSEIARNLPYARLMKPSIMYNDKDREAYNKRLIQAGSRLRRTEYGFKVDNMEFEAWLMVIAMPPSVADKKLGIINQQAYNRHVLGDPGMVERLRRGKLGLRLNAKAFGLSPIPIHRTEFAVTPYAKARQSETDPMRAQLFSVGKATPIPKRHFRGDVLGKWNPVIKQAVDRRGQVIGRYVIDFESTADPAKQEKILKSYLQAAGKATDDVRRVAHLFISDYLKEALEDRGHTVGSDIYRNVDLYIRYAEKETPHGTYRIPEVVRKIGLATYEAPVASHEYRTVFLQIKAPSEEVAKLLLFYRLLRRSTNNKELKNIMGFKDLHGKWTLFPDLHARFLTQWAYGGFKMLRSDEPRNVRFIQHRKYERRDPEMEKSKHLGVHAGATFLRTD